MDKTTGIIQANNVVDSPSTAAAAAMTVTNTNTAKTTMSMDDVTSLLKLDAAGIIMQAAKMEPTILEQVTKFASQLTFYATLQGLINNNQQQQQQQQVRTVSPSNNNNNKDSNNAGQEQMTNNSNNKTSNDNGVGPTSPCDSLTDTVMDFMNNCVENGQPFSPTAAMTAAMTAANNQVSANTAGTTELLRMGTPTVGAKSTVTGASRRSHEEATTGVSLANDKIDNATTGTEPTSKRPRIDKNTKTNTSITGTTDGLNDKENKAPKATKNKATLAALPPPPVIAIKNPEETKSPAGYNGSIAQSQVKRSVGLTRAVLNQHYISLGLTACFGVPVISKQGQNVSHLTLNHRWNDLPYDETQPLKWWLGTGTNRLSLASPLNPALVNPQPVIPIFFAQTNTGGGGALCHYVGHYQCNHFVTDMNVLFKTKPRQALIGFNFVRFDQTMADKLAKIAADNQHKAGLVGSTTIKSMEKHEVVHQDPVPETPAMMDYDPTVNQQQSRSGNGESSGFGFFHDTNDPMLI